MSRPLRKSGHRLGSTHSEGLFPAKIRLLSTWLFSIDDAKPKKRQSPGTTFQQKPNSTQRSAAKKSDDEFGTEAWLGVMSFLGVLLGLYLSGVL
jgi:hypothetical protein